MGPSMQTPFVCGDLSVLLQIVLCNSLLNLLGKINVWQLYYTIDSNYYCNDSYPGSCHWVLRAILTAVMCIIKECSAEEGPA